MQEVAESINVASALVRACEGRSDVHRARSAGPIRLMTPRAGGAIDPETYEVRADGELLTCEPATTLPLAQRYSLF